MRQLSLLAALLTLPLTGCDQLCDIAGAPGCELLAAAAPTVEASDLTLVESPALDTIAAHYCAEYFSLPFASEACEAALGEPASTDDMDFVFSLAIEIENTLDVPVPALEVLVSLTLFPGDDAEALGAVCVGLCGTDDPDCGQTPAADACQGQNLSAMGWSDMVGTVPSLVEGLADGEDVLGLADTMIVAGGDLRVDVALRLGAPQAIDVFGKLAGSFMDQFISFTGSPSLSIPVSIEGTVFFEIPGAGKTGVSYGPVQTDWQIL